MKIIRHGCLKGPKYTGTCHYCACEFQYEESDIHHFEDTPSQGFIYCPECNRKVTAVAYNVIKSMELETLKRLQQNEVPTN